MSIYGELPDDVILPGPWLSSDVDDRCAVEGCDKRGRPHVCPYDGRYHHHGCIHYDCGYPQHSVAFKTDGWRWVCNEHYQLLDAERRAWEERAQA